MDTGAVLPHPRQCACPSTLRVLPKEQSVLDSPCDPVDPAPSDPPSATEPGSHNLPPTSSAGTAAAIAGAAPKADDASRLLQALWPSQNRVHLAVYRNRAGKFWHVPVASAAKALVTAVAASAQGEDCYFALAEFASGDSRKADNAVSVCAFWLDIDCGADKAGSKDARIGADRVLRLAHGPAGSRAGRNVSTSIALAALAPGGGVP